MSIDWKLNNELTRYDIPHYSNFYFYFGSQNTEFLCRKKGLHFFFKNTKFRFLSKVLHFFSVFQGVELKDRLLEAYSLC